MKKINETYQSKFVASEDKSVWNNYQITFFFFFSAFLQDDLGAIGGSCPYIQEKTPSCISKGKIDASQNSTCSYQEGVTTGVLCCKLPGEST